MLEIEEYFELFKPYIKFSLKEFSLDGYDPVEACSFQNLSVAVWIERVDMNIDNSPLYIRFMYVDHFGVYIRDTDYTFKWFGSRKDFTDITYHSYYSLSFLSENEIINRLMQRVSKYTYIKNKYGLK